jgi:hypothetical protein
MGFRFIERLRPVRRNSEQVSPISTEKPAVSLKRPEKVAPTFTHESAKIQNGVLRFEVSGRWFTLAELESEHRELFSQADQDGSLAHALQSALY